MESAQVSKDAELTSYSKLTADKVDASKAFFLCSASSILSKQACLLKCFKSILFALLLSAGSLFAQTQTQQYSTGRTAADESEITIYYRFDKSDIDRTYLDNSAALKALDRLVDNYGNTIDSVVIVAYASPEGPATYNYKLSARRAESMKSYVLDRLDKERPTPVSAMAGGEDFEGVVRMIEADPNVPHKADVLRVLSRANGSNNDYQFYLVSKVANGEPYRYIRRNILPYLRSATTVILYHSTPVSMINEEKRPIGITVDMSFGQPVEQHEIAIPEITTYSYTITKEKIREVIPSDSVASQAERLTCFTLNIFKERELVGEYRLVAPNGITNLSGWYSLAAVPSLSGQAVVGSFDESGNACATHIAVDGREAALKSGAIKITHYEEDDRIDVEAAGVALEYSDGSQQHYDFEQLDCTGDGLPPVLTYVITTSDIDSLAGVSRYTLVVTDSKKGVVGEYSLVAPNGITNLSGWYSLTTTPEKSGQAVSGVYAPDGSTSETYVVVDGERVVLREGTIGISQRADNTIDITTENIVGYDNSGNEVRERVEMKEVYGDGVPFVGGRATDYVREAAATPRRHGFNLKTNLLYDAVTAINIGVEVPIGRRLSVETSWTFPWWLPESWNWCSQVLWGEVEGRVWLGDRARRGMMKGHFVGIYAGSGIYDLQFTNDHGWQGEFFEAGIGYGYVIGLKSGLNLEFELGLGYMQTDYRSYIHTQKADGSEVLFLNRTSDPNRPLQYFGPTKAKVALVWPITWQSKAKKPSDR